MILFTLVFVLAGSAEARGLRRHVRLAARACRRLLQGTNANNFDPRGELGKIAAGLRRHQDFEHVNLKSPLVLDYLKTLETSLGDKIEDDAEGDEPQSMIERSAELVRARTREYVEKFSADGIGYGALQKLGLLSALQFELLQEGRADHLRASGGGVPALMDSADDVNKFLAQDKFCFLQSSERCLRYDFKTTRRPAVYLPLFMGVSPEVVLWARSEGIAFLPQITASELLFDRNFSPAAVYLRKFRDRMDFLPDPEKKEFYRQLESQVLRGRDRELYARIFLLMNFNDDHPLTCEGFAGWILSGRHHAQGYFLSRATDDAFTNLYKDHIGRIDEAALTGALKRLVPKMRELCPLTEIRDPASSGFRF